MVWIVRLLDGRLLGGGSIIRMILTILEDKRKPSITCTPIGHNHQS